MGARLAILFHKITEMAICPSRKFYQNANSYNLARSPNQIAWVGDMLFEVYYLQFVIKVTKSSSSGTLLGRYSARSGPRLKNSVKLCQNLRLGPLVWRGIKMLYITSSHFGSSRPLAVFESRVENI